MTPSLGTTDSISGVQRRQNKSDVDPANRRSFNLEEERQRLEKWQKEQERIRQEQYEQEQRRLQEEQEKDLQRAEYESRRKQDMEQRAMQERRRMLQRKAQEELKKREEEMLERERKERERRRLEQLAREEEEERKRREEERLQEEREEQERLERERIEREEAARRREEELLLVQRRREEEKREKEMERQRIRQEREARERKAREKIEREKEEYERLLREREEERERLAKEMEERERIASEREARKREAQEEEEKRAMKEREERQRSAKEREAKLQAAVEQEERARAKRPFTDEVIRPQVQQHQESAPPPSRHHHQPDEDLLQRIREEERERIRLEERDRLRREWEQLEQEKKEQLENQRKEREEIERLRQEQAELKREREKIALQQQEELERLAKQRELYSKSMNNVFDNEDVERKNNYNRRKQHGSEEDLRKPHLSKPLGTDIMEGKMVPERDSQPVKSYMAKYKDENIPTEQHWLVEEAKRRQHGPLVSGKDINSLPIHPRNDSLDHEPVLERKVFNQEHAAPPSSSTNYNNANSHGKEYVKNDFEQEIPTRIPPPNRAQGSAPRTKQPTHPHQEPSPTYSDTNRWDAPRHHYDTQPEFKHVQRRMHGGQGDAERKQKMHNRRSMPDLTQDQGFAAPVTRIMDDQRIPRGPGGGPAARGVGPPSPHHGQPRGQPPPQHGPPGGDQRRQGQAPDSLIQCCVCNIQLGNGTKGTDVRIRANKLHCQNCYSNDAGFEFTEV
nr:trichohyalin-like isoform X2 [Lytechinus pictus]